MFIRGIKIEITNQLKQLHLSGLVGSASADWCGDILIFASFFHKTNHYPRDLFISNSSLSPVLADLGRYWWGKNRRHPGCGPWVSVSHQLAPYYCQLIVCRGERDEKDFSFLCQCRVDRRTEAWDVGIVWPLDSPGIVIVHSPRLTLTLGVTTRVMGLLCSTEPSALVLSLLSSEPGWEIL